MSYGKHSARHGKHTATGKRTVTGKHSAPRKHSVPRKHSSFTGTRIAAAGLAVAVAAACVPAGISLAQPAQGTGPAAAAGAAQSTELAETPEAEEMTAAEKAAIDRVIEKYTLTTGEKAVKIARAFLGTPYVWGGAAPGGFDCSGLTSYVYGKLGVSLAHYAQTQYGQGTAVARDELQPGDLVFFGGGTGSITHVGFYVGGGKYLHAPKTGDVVKVSRLADRSDYVGACRPW